MPYPYEPFDSAGKPIDRPDDRIISGPPLTFRQPDAPWSTGIPEAYLDEQRRLKMASEKNRAIFEAAVRIANGPRFRIQGETDAEVAGNAVAMAVDIWDRVYGSEKS